MHRRGEYRIRNASTGDDGPSVTEILLYDEIGEDPWWGTGVSARQFVEDLQAVDTDELHLRINSPGGDVFEGITMANAVRRHQSKVIAFVDGLAASSASFLAMAADEVVMSRNAELMIHDAWGLVIGNAADMTKMADDLNRSSDNIASMYADRAGGTVNQWRKAMQAETWYTDSEAVSAGLADRVDAGKTAGDKSKNRFNLSLFAYAGREHAPAPEMFRTPAEPDTPNNQEGSDMSDTLIKGLRERLGLSADAGDEEILATLDVTLNNSETPPEPPPAGDDPDADDEESTDDEPEDEPEAAPGTVIVDEETLNALRRDAQAGREARNQQQAEHREQLVAAAINDGRIAPARRQDWLNTLERDPGAEATLAGLAKGLVPVDTKGYTGGLAETGDDDYDLLFPDEKKGA
jgi:ATP-dependent protease ClpP protease subunit